MRRRRPQRSASAMATNDTSTPARAIASATPRAWSVWLKALVTASPFWDRRAPEKLATRATAASAARRPACSGVNATGGTTGRSFNGAGASAPVAAASRRAAAWGSARRAPSHAWRRRNQVKNGTRTVLDVSRARRVECADDSTIVACRRALVSGMPAIEPSKALPFVGSAATRASSSVSARWTCSRSASTVISIERRTCGMLRRPRLEESPDGPARRRQPRPAFTLTDQHGKKVKLSDFKGKKVVVYFYPKADTPGCTTQSCALRDAEPDLKKLKAVVLGISPDTPEKQAKFDEKYGLGFELLADTEHTVAEKYGVWGEKVNYGRKYMGIIRSAFVVDATGKLAAAFYKISPKDTVPKVTKVLEELA